MRMTIWVLHMTWLCLLLSKRTGQSFDQSMRDVFWKRQHAKNVDLLVDYIQVLYGFCANQAVVVQFLQEALARAFRTELDSQDLDEILHEPIDDTDARELAERILSHPNIGWMSGAKSLALSCRFPFE